MEKKDWIVDRVLAEQAAKRGDQDFMVVGNGRYVTYGEADERATRVANGLKNLGVEAGEHVGVMLPNSLEYAYAWFGVCRMGAVHVAINTAYKGVFLEHVLNNAGPKVMLIHPDYLPWLVEIEGRVPTLEKAIIPGLRQMATPPVFQRIVAHDFDELLKSPATPVEHEISYRDTGVIMYTSGTTGPSKGVLMPHAHLYLFAKGTVDNLKLNKQDIYYICMPLFHANAMLMQFYGAMLVGAKVAVVPGFSASGWLKDVRRFGATITNTLGVMAEFLLRQPSTVDDKNHNLRVIQAVPLPEEVEAGMAEKYGVRAIEAYGMTEVNIPLYRPLDGPSVPNSCGQVYDAYFDVRILDPETDEECPRGVLGEIVVRPKEPFGFMQGYNAMPEKTVEAWRNFWFHTGDAGTCDKEGNFFFVDRIKDCIRRRGENISSYEIEKVIGEMTEVAEVAAVAVPSEIRGGEDEILACIVLKNGATLAHKTVLDFCAPKMPHFAVPRFVSFLSELPKTPTQKVQKAKLRAGESKAEVWDREEAGYKVSRGV